MKKELDIKLKDGTTTVLKVGTKINYLGASDVNPGSGKIERAGNEFGIEQFRVELTDGRLIVGCPGEIKESIRSDSHDTRFSLEVKKSSAKANRPITMLFCDRKTRAGGYFGRCELKDEFNYCDDPNGNDYYSPAGRLGDTWR